MAIQLCRRWVPGSEVLVLAFNVKNREELNKRLPAGYRGYNSHNLGFAGMQGDIPKARRDATNGFSWKDVVEDMEVDAATNTRCDGKIQALCSKVMLNHGTLKTLAKLYSTSPPSITSEDVEPPVVKAVAKCGIRKAVGFLKIPGHWTLTKCYICQWSWDLQPPKVKFVFVDEAQDLTCCSREIASRSCADDARMVIVGDARKQAIYMFAGANAASFEKFKTMRPNTRSCR